VINLITGFGETAGAMVKHPAIKKIAFTGSTRWANALGKYDESLAGVVELGGKHRNHRCRREPDEAIAVRPTPFFFNQGQVFSPARGFVKSPFLTMSLAA
jgi:aldehyde dehydrogenase (NAD+)